MDPLDSLLREIESIERHLDRRRFLRTLLGAGLAPRLGLETGDREFLRRVAATLISADDLRRTRIDVVANIEHLGLARIFRKKSLVTNYTNYTN